MPAPLCYKYGVQYTFYRQAIGVLFPTAAYWQAERLGWRPVTPGYATLNVECCLAFNRKEAMLLEHWSLL